jgi:two-component system chemotaxis response regulator CheY
MSGRLLIVDDSLISRRTIERAASNLGGYAIRSAEDGAAAMLAFADFKPDIVTLDITMPDMDGLACVAAMLAVDPTVSILIISARKEKATAIEAVKRGARGFLPKPFTESEFRDEIADLARVKV